MPDSDRPDGIVGAYTADDLTVKITFTTFLALALYNSLELAVLIFATFKRYEGLYFWSLLLAGLLGVVPQSVSFILKYFDFAPLWFTLTLSTIGWYFMVTGQALVLFSRLNLVVQNRNVQRFVLGMIICDAIALHIPTTVLTYGSNFIGSSMWVHAYTIMERIELTGFCLQETIISGLYIFHSVKILRLLPPMGNNTDPGRAILYQTLAINFLIILLDVSLMTMGFLDYFVIQTTFKSFVYSLKLKLEFGVLGRLLSLMRSRRHQVDGHQSHSASRKGNSGAEYSVSVSSKAQDNFPLRPLPGSWQRIEGDT
ncbi:hypothetical protein N7457_002669 [Penicillium paradoxum]|uniref:uncharacterized protein n=1 Tax=Penicillium paradoxum TaxID=176176 RepID=UPI002547114A|nr:uncharacterized protein N7457_002669 [Penicillium paradoxum]KAJ5787679.1 hypothetical protein N7457_002669 [Penicillium paradoxum]